MKIADDECVLNKLIIFNNNIGRIKYVGPIHDQKNDTSNWYGIEWKDSSRGKHDGSYMGHKYFCTKHPTGGSFVKPNKVDFGIEIWAAVEHKYFEDEQKSTEEDQDLFLYNNFDPKLKCLKLNCISLANSRISSLNTLEKLNQHFTNLKELDLEENLFNSWSQIFLILKQIKTLRIINLSNNLLETNELISDDKDNIFESINNLILNKMGYDWNDISKILKHFPKINELKVCFNNITEINGLEQTTVDNLKILDLESNPINEWKNFEKLSELKELETLYANDIGLNEIEFKDCDFKSKTFCFPKLKILFLNSNKINNWKSINELSKLKSLNELNLKLNPLNQTDKPETIRQLIIVKIENLKFYNRTPILPKERKGAQFDYLKKFGKEWLDLENLPQEHVLKFHKEHPNYETLVKKLGAVEKCEIEIKPDTLKSNLISLNILNEVTGQVITRKLPTTTEVKRLKLIISNLFKSSNFETESLRLFYKTKKNPEQEYELDNNFRILNFYSIENDDTLIVRN